MFFNDMSSHFLQAGFDYDFSAVPITLVCSLFGQSVPKANNVSLSVIIIGKYDLVFAAPCLSMFQFDTRKIALKHKNN